MQRNFQCSMHLLAEMEESFKRDSRLSPSRTPSLSGPEHGPVLWPSIWHVSAARFPPTSPLPLPFALLSSSAVPEKSLHLQFQSIIAVEINSTTVWCSSLCSKIFTKWSRFWTSANLYRSEGLLQNLQICADSKKK